MRSDVPRSVETETPLPPGRKPVRSIGRSWIRLVVDKRADETIAVLRTTGDRAA